MCGIWGYIGTEDGNGLPVDDAWTGLSALTDRGPDDWGMYVNGAGKVTDESTLPDGDARVALGNRRLSILDLSAAGNQPMGDDDGGWIVYNGEVYNYRELRDDLRELGHGFDSDSDTEVILHAYREWGTECVERLRGMFAFAIYEPAEDRLFAARDRFGIKPFYYGHRESGLAFASEVTSLLESGVVDRQLDPKSVDGFLALGYVPEPRTIVEGVRALPAGSTMVYDAAAGTCDVERYWRPEFGDGEDATAMHVRELLVDSVDLRLRSDVPVGAFLSGGLDSSTVVALMREASEPNRGDLHTFSIGFEHESYSETDYAERVAEEFGTDHTSVTVTADDVREELDDIIAAMDQPTIDGVNTYFVSKVAAEAGLKVVLSGLGSDELFHGYPSFEMVPRRYRAAKALYAVPGVVRRPVAEAVERLGSWFPDLPTAEAADAVRADNPFGAAYLAERGIFTTGQRRELLEGVEPTDWAARIEGDVREVLDGSGPSEAVSWAELAWYMRGQLLRDTDGMSMSHSLEVRVPFLDGPLAEYVMAASEASKSVGEKGLLKEAVRADVPMEIIEREKTGFTFPFEEWLQEELEGVVEGSVTATRTEPTPLSATSSSRTIQAFRRGELHWSRAWALVVLTSWVQQRIATN